MHFETLLLRPNFLAHPAEKSLSRVGNPPFVFAFNQNSKTRSSGGCGNNPVWDIIQHNSQQRNATKLVIFARREMPSLFIFLYFVTGSVADQDPGSSVFLIPGSGLRIWDGKKSGSEIRNIPDPISASLVAEFWGKNA
jgi:hypothetical protein